MQLLCSHGYAVRHFIELKRSVDSAPDDFGQRGRFCVQGSMPPSNHLIHARHNPGLRGCPVVRRLTPGYVPSREPRPTRVRAARSSERLRVATQGRTAAGMQGEHPTEIARKALVDAAHVEGGELGDLMIRVALALPTRSPRPVGLGSRGRGRVVQARPELRLVGPRRSSA